MRPVALPDFPWDSLAADRALAEAHAGGIVDLSVGTPVDPVPDVVPLPGLDGSPALATVDLLATVEAGIHSTADDAGVPEILRVAVVCCHAAPGSSYRGAKPSSMSCWL